LPSSACWAGTFRFGAFDAVQHYILRVLLCGSGCAPLDYVRFLDYAALELNFLQKVGGGYIFIHRYLLEHFAALPARETMREPAGIG
jgi:hypothetical protein